MSYDPPVAIVDEVHFSFKRDNSVGRLDVTVLDIVFEHDVFDVEQLSDGVLFGDHLVVYSFF